MDGLRCEEEYQFRLSAYGDGVVFGAAWSEPSETLLATTGMCVPPVFVQASYSFSVMEDAAVDDEVGTVSATDDSGEPVAYAITAGNGAGRFAIDEESGAITVAAQVRWRLCRLRWPSLAAHQLGRDRAVRTRRQAELPPPVRSLLGTARAHPG